MTLTGPQIERITEAIRRAYSRDELRRAVLVCMDEDFDSLVSEKAYAAQVFELVAWANRQSRAVDLLRCAYEHNRTNEALRALWAELAPASGAAHAAAAGDIFLSYSHHDSAFARRLYADFAAAGFSVWADEGLAPGTQNWQDAIEAAVGKCRCMVVVMTPHAKASRGVRIEVDLAQELEKPIYPVLANGERKDAVLFSLRDVQYLDARSDYPAAVQRKLILELGKYLGGAAAARSAPPVAVRVVKQATSELRTAPLEIEWVTIADGEFPIGSDKSKDKQALDNEMPQHSVKLPTYHIAKYPVTNAQYLEFVKASGHAAPRHWQDGMIPQGKENHPVVHVTWRDACAYCAWASSVAQCTIRLPSEAEWEKAARGTDGRIWPWGTSRRRKTCATLAARKEAQRRWKRYPLGRSPYGVMDMAGNVWEWTSSQYNAYPYDAADGREEQGGDVPRTLRGGAWNYIDYVRCAARLDLHPVNWSGDVGFRVVSPGS